MVDISKRFSISYKWWGHLVTSISPEHQAALDDTADKQIMEGLCTGANCGSMYKLISEDVNTIVEYRGWWQKGSLETVAYIL